MPVLGKGTVKNFERAYKKVREAKLAMIEAGKKDFPVGVKVFYSHGDYERTGVVNMSLGDRVRITTPNQKEVWIECTQITQVKA